MFPVLSKNFFRKVLALQSSPQNAIVPATSRNTNLFEAVLNKHNISFKDLVFMLSKLLTVVFQ